MGSRDQKRNREQFLDFIAKETNQKIINEFRIKEKELLAAPLDEAVNNRRIKRFAARLLVRGSLDDRFNLALCYYIVHSETPSFADAQDVLFDIVCADGTEIKSMFGSTKRSAEYAEKFPFRIYFGPLARQRDIIESLKENWKFIEKEQKALLPKKRIREKTRREVYDLIWRNKEKTPATIQDIIKAEYPISVLFYSVDEISLILTQEAKRRQK